MEGVALFTLVSKLLVFFEKDMVTIVLKLLFHLLLPGKYYDTTRAVIVDLVLKLGALDKVLPADYCLNDEDSSLLVCASSGKFLF